MKLIERVEKLKHNFWRFRTINWIKSIWFNFRFLPYKQAIKLPVLFWGKVKFHSLNGSVKLNCDVSYGMINFGKCHEYIRRNTNTAELTLDGEFVINGHFDFGFDYSVVVLRNAVLKIGDNVYFGNQTKLIVSKGVTIGSWVRFGYESQLADTNYHYTMDTITGKVAPLRGEIFIDDFCWIGNRSTIMKGTKTNQYLIIGSNSLCNRDYTVDIPSQSLIGGIPAKLIRSNIVRIFDPKREMEIEKFFNKNPDSKYYIANEL
jgi:acetyltransferase-like isoleucine patch superfamily enzyme